MLYNYGNQTHIFRIFEEISNKMGKMVKIDPKHLKMVYSGYIFIIIDSIGISNHPSCQFTAVLTSNILIETIFQSVLVEKVLNFGLKFTKGKHIIGRFSEGQD